MRRFILSLVLGASLALLSAGVTLGVGPDWENFPPPQPFWIWLPDQACINPATDAGHGTFPFARSTSGNGVVPMYMSFEPFGCMTMVGLHP